MCDKYESLYFTGSYGCDYLSMLVINQYLSALNNWMLVTDQTSYFIFQSGLLRVNKMYVR